jgi:hypothetical protein
VCPKVEYFSGASSTYPSTESSPIAMHHGDPINSAIRQRTREFIEDVKYDPDFIMPGIV